MDYKEKLKERMNELGIFETEHITSKQVSKILGLTRQWSHALMKKYIDSDGQEGLYSKKIGHQYITNFEGLAKYYKKNYFEKE